MPNQEISTLARQAMINDDIAAFSRLATTFTPARIEVDEAVRCEWLRSATGFLFDQAQQKHAP